MTGEWRELHIMELSDLYSSPSIVRVIKSRGMKYVGLVARMRERRGICRGFVGNLRERRPLGRPGIDGRISKWIFRKWDVGVWTE